MPGCRTLGSGYLIFSALTYFIHDNTTIIVLEILPYNVILVLHFKYIFQLQDRTQFSDRDLATLKKYWDNGMTSLGSVCREKIEAVAIELNVDCEIVRVRHVQ